MRALSLFSIKTGIMIKGQTVFYSIACEYRINSFAAMLTVS
jgi:hypothetical protein